MTQRIEHVDIGTLKKILDSVRDPPGRYEPRGLYLAVTPDGFIAMDNSTQEAWMELFKSRNVAIRWLRGALDTEEAHVEDRTRLSSPRRFWIGTDLSDGTAHLRRIIITGRGKEILDIKEGLRRVQELRDLGYVIDFACFELDFVWVAVVPFASVPLTPGFQGWVENALERRFVYDGIITAVVPREGAE